MEQILAVFESAVVAGLPLLAVLFGLVQWIKETFSLEGRSVKITSMVVGLILGTGYQFSQAVPVGFAGWFSLAIFGIGLGLVASGVFDAAKQLSKSNG